MPKIIRFYIRHVLIGFALAAGFVSLLLWFNVANLSHLIFSSPDWALALFMLWFFHGIVFAGVQFGCAVMAMAERPEEDGPRGGRPIPVRVEAAKPRSLLHPRRK